MVNLRKSPQQLFSKALTHIRVIQDTIIDLEGIKTRKLPDKKEHLFQSYIFHLVAIWQTFIEKNSTDAFHYLYKSVPKEIPMLQYVLDRFNTPNTQEIDRLFYNIIGLKCVSSSWFWDGFTNQEAKNRLALMLKIRHKIAHEGHAGVVLDYEKNFDCTRFLFNLATLTQNSVFEFVAANGGRVPHSKLELPYPELKQDTFTLPSPNDAL